MKVFTGIDPADDLSALAPVARRIAEGLGELAGPRSLCELGLDDEDYHWLEAWARHLSPRTVQNVAGGAWSAAVRQSAHGLSPLEAVGLLLLLVAAESARRHAREGGVWSAVADQFAPATQRRLFVQGQPTYTCKEAIEAGARRLGLRHVFGLEGVQNYYVSVYLQFGFTRRGMGQLPSWLAGYVLPEAVRYLLHDRHLCSESFRVLWHHLQEYRRNNIPEARLRRAIESSPWVLPEWADELVQRARDQIELGTASQGDEERDEPAPLPFLLPPRLRWEPPAPPRFTAAIAHLAALDLTAERYHLRTGGVRLDTWLRQEDDVYLHAGEVELPCASGHHVVTLTADDGTLLISLPIDLWDPDEEVTAYDMATGRRVDAWGDRLNQERAYALITTADLAVEPSPHDWQLLAGGAVRLSLLRPGWPTDLRVRLGPDALWTPHLGTGRRTPPEEPAWARRIHLTLPWGLGPGDGVTATVAGLDPDTRLSHVRLGNTAQDFREERDGAVLQPVGLTPNLAAQGLRYNLGLRRGGELVRIHRTVEPGLFALARFGPEGWEWVDSERPLTVEEAQAFPYRVFVSRSWHRGPPNELALMEGTTFSRRIWRGLQAMGALAGFGAPLTIRRGPYNDTGDSVPLASAVIHPGILRDVDASAGHLRLRLSRAIEPGPDHQVVIWPPGHPPRVIGADRIDRVDDAIWLVPETRVDLDQDVVAIAHAGVRLGARWPRRLPERQILAVSEPARARQVADMLRWSHAPIQFQGWARTIRRFTGARAPETLAAWLLNEDLPAGLCAPPDGEEWRAAVRAVFWESCPPPFEARSVVSALMGATAEPLAAVQALLRVDPLLMGRVLLAWGKDRGPGAAHRIQACAVAVSGLAEDSNFLEQRRHEERLLCQAARTLDVDDGFLQAGITRPALRSLDGSALRHLDATNLAIALGVAPFRQYLALRVLADVQRRMEGRSIHGPA